MDDGVHDSPPHDESRFKPDRSIALRSIREYGRHGRAVGFVVAGFAIADGDDGVIAVATPPGSDLRTRAGEGSGPNGRLVLPDDWDGTHAELAWHGPTVVRVYREGDEWSVWRWHNGDTWVGDWYGNLESPWRRTSIGFDTQDWVLDVVCSGTPGTDSWTVRYKDEGELEWLVRLGTFAPAEAERARDAGERLTARAKSLEWPFDADWGAWVPSRYLPTATLPAGWTDLD